MRRTLRTLSLLLPLAACGGTKSDAGDAPADSADVVATDSAAVARAEPEPMPDEVYFDLTRFDWYRRSEPLVHERRDYRAEGDPITEPLDSLKKVGRYQGVDYYARKGAPQPFYTLYVPVYYRYWQRFIAPPAAGGSS